MSRLEAVPAIAAATPVNVAPFSGDGGWDVPSFTAEGQTAERAAANPSLNLESVHPNYFATFGVPLVRGRAFTPADREGAIDVAIVSEDVAARTWPGQDPIGKRVKMGTPESRDGWRTVVGVAAPTRYRELEKPRATIYLPAAQFLETAERIVLRTTASLDLTAALSRDVVKSVDPDVQVMRDGIQAVAGRPARAPQVQRVSARHLRRRGVAAHGDWALRRHGGIRPPAGSRDCAACRAGRDGRERAQTRARRGALARRRRRSCRPGRSRGRNPRRAGHALRSRSARSTGPAGRRRAADRGVPHRVVLACNAGPHGWMRSPCFGTSRRVPRGPSGSARVPCTVCSRSGWGRRARRDERSHRPYTRTCRALSSAAGAG